MRTWEPVVVELGDSYQTVRLHLRRWGDSDAPKDGYRLSEMADDTSGVVAALERDGFVLWDTRWECKVAQLLASRHPKGLRGLILVAPSPPVPPVLSPEAHAQMMSAYESRESVSGPIDHMLTAIPLTAALREQVISDSLRGGPQAKAAWPTKIIFEDISRQVGAIDAPTLVISGERDRVDPIENLQRELMPRIQSGPQLVTHRPANHSSHLDRLFSEGCDQSCLMKPEDVALEFRGAALGDKRRNVRLGRIASVNG